jgi:hypothetical protein
VNVLGKPIFAALPLHLTKLVLIGAIQSVPCRSSAIRFFTG